MEKIILLFSLFAGWVMFVHAEAGVPATMDDKAGAAEQKKEGAETKQKVDLDSDKFHQKFHELFDNYWTLNDEQRTGAFGYINACLEQASTQIKLNVLLDKQVKYDLALEAAIRSKDTITEDHLINSTDRPDLREIVRLSKEEAKMEAEMHKFAYIPTKWLESLNEAIQMAHASWEEPENIVLVLTKVKEEIEREQKDHKSEGGSHAPTATPSTPEPQAKPEQH